MHCPRNSVCTYNICCQDGLVLHFISVYRSHRQNTRLETISAIHYIQTRLLTILTWTTKTKRTPQKTVLEKLNTVRLVNKLVQRLITAVLQPAIAPHPKPRECSSYLQALFLYHQVSLYPPIYTDANQAISSLQRFWQYRFMLFSYNYHISHM